MDTGRAMPPPQPGRRRDGAGPARLSRRDWYKDAIVYQLHVKAFQDSDGDGTGDFAGLMQRLDYVEQLGVNAIWLLPFYPSPLRDDGYDIADYRRINPSYGAMRDFRRFIAEAHRRFRRADAAAGLRRAARRQRDLAAALLSLAAAR